MRKKIDHIFFIVSGICGNPKNLLIHRSELIQRQKCGAATVGNALGVEVARNVAQNNKGGASMIISKAKNAKADNFEKILSKSVANISAKERAGNSIHG